MVSISEMSKYYTSNHPTRKKLEAIFKLMDELGICIFSDGKGHLIVEDRERSLRTYRIKEIDDVSTPFELPLAFDYRIISEVKERSHY